MLVQQQGLVRATSSSPPRSLTRCSKAPSRQWSGAGSSGSWNSSPLHCLLGELVEAVGHAANAEEPVAQLVQNGAQSIQMYIGERDGMAPVDLSLAVAFAKANESAFSSIGGG